MDGKRKGFLVALIIGVLAGPALAIGAARLLAAPPAAAASAVAVTPAATPAAGTDPVPAAADLAPDLETACTVEGTQLVRLEAAGMLSDLQQAALDALRPICEQEGLALAAPFLPKGAASAAASPESTAPPSGEYNVAVGGEIEDEHAEDHEYEDLSDEDRSDEDWAGGGGEDDGSGG